MLLSLNKRSRDYPGNLWEYAGKMPGFSWNSSCLMRASDEAAYAKRAECCSSIGCSFPLTKEAGITQEIFGNMLGKCQDFLGIPLVSCEPVMRQRMPNAQNAARVLDAHFPSRMKPGIPRKCWEYAGIMPGFSWNSICLMRASDEAACAKRAECCLSIGCSFPLTKEAGITQEIMGICWDNASNFFEFLLSHASQC